MSIATLLKCRAISLFCIASFVTLGGCGGGGSSASATPAKTPIEQTTLKLPSTLIIVGDSIMAGCEESLNQPDADYSMTTAHLVAQLGVRVVNLSRSGNTMAIADTQRVDGGINFTQTARTAIWIALGANDFIWEVSSLQQYRNHYLNLLSRINPISARKIFCATPLISSFDYEHRINSKGATLEDYRMVVRDIAAEGHCTLAETSQWFDSAEIYDECHMPDTLHLGQDGHRDYANHLLEAIRADYSAL